MHFEASPSQLKVLRKRCFKKVIFSIAEMQIVHGFANDPFSFFPYSLFGLNSIFCDFSEAGVDCGWQASKYF